MFTIQVHVFIVGLILGQLREAQLHMFQHIFNALAPFSNTMGLLACGI